MMTTAFVSGSPAVLRDWLRRGLSWWLEELSQIAPARVLRLLRKDRGTAAVLRVDARSAELLLPAGPRSRPASLMLSGYPEEKNRARVAAAMQSHGGNRGISVALQSSLVFETYTELPAAAAASLPLIVANQIGRLVPLPASEVCFAHEIAERPRDRPVLRVRILIAKRATIDDALATARAAGLEPGRVIAASVAQGAADRPLTLWQADHRRRESKAGRRLRRILDIAIVALAVAACGIYVNQLDRQRRELRAQVAEAKRLATAVQETKRHVDATAAAVSFFASRRDAPGPRAILDQLTRLIPPDSWIDRLSVRGRSVELSGYSPRATELISRIEGSSVFEHPRFRSAITLAPDENSQRFGLSFEIRLRERQPNKTGPGPTR